MENLLFIDIETHRVKNWDELSLPMQRGFTNHCYEKNGDKGEYSNVNECYCEKAALLAEFSQVICVSLGYESCGEFKVVSYWGVDEVELLMRLLSTLESFHKKGYSLAGHNINGFDKPYLIKRYIINSIKVPVILNSIGVKPWELNDVDTMQRWKMDGWGVTSLEVISAALDVKCKTTELNGGNMYRYDIKDIDWEELRMYCEEDTRASYEIYKKIKTYL